MTYLRAACKGSVAPTIHTHPCLQPTHLVHDRRRLPLAQDARGGELVEQVRTGHELWITVGRSVVV